MSNDNASKKALKSGVWYTLSNFLINGAAFITTPLFARLLTKTEYGEYSNFTSWMSIISILVTLELAGCVIRAKYDFEDNFDGFLSSITFLGTIITLVAYIIVLVFHGFFEHIFSMELKYIHLMFLNALVAPALRILQNKHRVFQKYISFAIIAVGSTIVSTGISLICVMKMEDRLFGRLYGMIVPLIIVYIGAYIIIIAKGRTVFNLDYWKYAIAFCLPLVPHLLSNVILGSSDRIMIRNRCGAEAVAVYSLAYSVGMIISILFNALNQAWEPWLFERLNAGDKAAVKRVSRYYLIFFILLVEGAVLLSPEIMLIMGGKAYAESIYVIPPVMVGYGAKFVYTFYVNSERYEKKTAYISIGTMIAAGVNYCLNAIFIPIFGYMAAAYTTLIGFLLLVIMHYLTCKKMGIADTYDNGFIFIMLAVMIVSGIACQLLYTGYIARYAVIVIVGMIALIFGKNLLKMRGN